MTYMFRREIAGGGSMPTGRKVWKAAKSRGETRPTRHDPHSPPEGFHSQSAETSLLPGKPAPGTLCRVQSEGPEPPSAR